MSPFTLYQTGYSLIEDLGLAPYPKESIYIVNPISDQKVNTGNGLLVSGQSSDSDSKDCTVSVIVNNVKPYQKAAPTGTGGPNDYSQWRFRLDENYIHLNEGWNKITAKLSCLSIPTRWYSINVTGVDTTQINSGVPLSKVKIDSDVQSKEQFNTPLVTLPNNKDYSKALSVSVGTQENPVGKGDTENFTIIVTDPDAKVIQDAQIDGKLVYPDGNNQKKFSGSTDANGRFVYPWTLDDNVGVGKLRIDVEAKNPAYEPGSVTSSFEIISPFGSSNNNDGITVPSSNNQKDGFGFVVAGDYGCDGTTRQTINAMTDKNPDLVLALGDLSEVKDPDCFFDLVSNIYDQDKLKIVLGEHDTDSDDDDDSSSRFSQYVRHFNLAKPFYSYDYQNIHFLAMSTGKDIVIPYAINSTQYNFVNSDLAQASNNDKIDWIIVYGYRPFYSSPTTHPAPASLREIYPPLFEKYGVDLVITAHNHNYQRTYPLLFNSKHPTDPIVKDRSITDYNNPGAPIYVTVGTAGGNLYDLLGQAPYVANQFKNTGFLDVDITNKGTQLKATFLNSIDGIDEDNFNIIKS